jgi:heme-degrading monooxygenase HmoA
MYARVTQFDIDTMRIDLDAALERFKELILPALRQYPGYQGVYALRTDEGNGLLITLWDSPEAANAGVTSGFYNEQVSKFLSFYKEPPGRQHYLVAFEEVLSHSASETRA